MIYKISASNLICIRILNLKDKVKLQSFITAFVALCLLSDIVCESDPQILKSRFPEESTGPATFIFIQ